MCRSKLLTPHLEALIAEPVDVVIELLGGIEPARTLISKALRLGRNVVTANKALLADDLTRLQRLASNNGERSGTAPLSEVSCLLSKPSAVFDASRRCIQSPGVLNGTTNFILDQLANGCDFA